jgi:hypothetical protein
MSRIPQALAVAALSAVALLAVHPAAACVGDCNGDGEISIAELITGVRIGVGAAPIEACVAFDANGDHAVGIDELVRAVTAGLHGCPATPTSAITATPSATATDTATATPTAAAASATPSPTVPATPTATPSATPTHPPVAGLWHEAPLALTSSTCSPLITDAFGADLASRPPCDQMVAMLDANTVALTDCAGTRLVGTLAGDGTLSFVYPPTRDTTDQCTVALTAGVTVPAGTRPTTATYVFALAFSGSCVIGDCQIRAQAAWTR